MKFIHKLFLIILLLAIGIIITFSFTVYFLTSSSLERVISRQQQDLAFQTMDRVERFLSEKSSDMISIAKQKEFSDLLEDEKGTKSASMYASMVKLQELGSTTGPWDSLAVVGSNGQIVSSTNKNELDTNILGQPGIGENYIKIQNGENYRSNPVINSYTKQPTMVFASPIKNGVGPSQHILGAVVGRLSWSAVTNLLQNPKGVDIELFDSKGMILGDSNPQKNNSRVALQKALLGESGTTITTDSVNGKEQELTSYTQGKRMSGTKNDWWVLTVATPVSQAFESAQGNAFISALIAIPIALFSVLFIIFVFQRFIMNPISSLTKAAKEISAGNLNKRVKVNYADEVGGLASSFNEMADKLQGLYSGLEQKVQEKTAALDQKVKDIVSERSRDEAILQGVSDGLIVTDNSGTILLMNSIASQILSLPHGVYIGKRIFQVFSLADINGKPANPQIWPYINATLTGIKSAKDFLYTLPNGRKIELNITASPFLGGGKITGAITIIRDVTKERQVDRMKTEFISLASHQLRTPLSAIRWFTEMLLNGDAGKLNSEQEDFAKNVSDSTQRMIDLVNSLLNISRIESGRIVIDPKPTDLKELIETVIVEVKPKADLRKQHIIVSVHGDLPPVNLDPKLIRQVYLNLLTNAIKYTPEEGEISVFISKKDKEIISQVSDNGYGIPKEQQGRIFERFFRATNIIKKETDGTGLGLYLIKAIIESSHGKIWFRSEENHGTSFFFSLPVSGMEAKSGEVTLD